MVYFPFGCDLSSKANISKESFDALCSAGGESWKVAAVADL